MHCLSSEFNSEPKVKNTFEHPTREGKCAGTPANGLQKGKKKERRRRREAFALRLVRPRVKRTRWGRVDEAGRDVRTRSQTWPPATWRLLHKSLYE